MPNISLIIALVQMYILCLLIDNVHLGTVYNMSHTYTDIHHIHISYLDGKVFPQLYQAWITKRPLACIMSALSVFFMLVYKILS